jgi:hypothetical protein
MVRNARRAAHEARLLGNVADAHRVLHRVFRSHPVCGNAVPPRSRASLRRFLPSGFRKAQALRAACALGPSGLFHSILFTMLAVVIVRAASASVQVSIGHLSMLREVRERLFDVADTTLFHPQF